MKNLKKIDNLFQENLKNLEVNPPEMVWNNIERELSKKKSRKIIPFWWKFSGVAAVLLLGFVIGKEYSGIYNPKNGLPKNPITSTKESNTSQDSAVVNAKKSSQTKEDQINSKENDAVANAKKSSQTNENRINANLNNAVANAKKASQTNKNRITSNINNAVANVKKASQTNKNKINSNVNNAVANENVSSKITLEKNTALENKNIITKKTDVENVQISFDENQKNIALNEKPQVKKDSISPKNNELKNLLAEKTNKKSIATKTNKWQIMPNIAPVYFSSTSSNSPIDARFDNNQKSYDKNISIGLAVNYSINKKIAIRSGINSFSVGYNTAKIGFYESNATTIALQPIVNIITNGTNSEDLILIGTSNQNITESTLSALSPNNPTINEGTLTQKITYIEVPLEVSYSIINKKIGVNIIAGMSALFLNKNEVSIKSSNQNLDFGQSTNLSDIHYSTNIGLGLNYKITKSFRINLEPMLKYQIKTFTNDVGDYKPYFVGVYSGVSYEF